MKLIIVGASGFVATELVRHSLQLAAFTEVVALSRQAVHAPEGLDSAAASKLRSVVIKDYGEYPDDVKKQLAGADACIWTVAITPSKSFKYKLEELRTVIVDNTLSGLEAICEARGSKTAPLRFLYMSGAASSRDLTKKAMVMGDYGLLRGGSEVAVLQFAKDHVGQVEACVAKPGFIIAPGERLKTAVSWVMGMTIGIPKIELKEIAAAMLYEVANGFEKEPLENADLVSIGRKSLQSNASRSQ